MLESLQIKLILKTVRVLTLFFSADLVNLGQTDNAAVYCGPFGSEKPTRAYTRFREDQPSWLTSVLGYLVSEPVVIPIFMILL